VVTCAVDADCAAGSYCNATACVASAPNGQKPGGVNCTRPAQCLSNVCGTDGTCGAPNGSGCGSPLTCRSGVCDSVDGKCGLANGDGPCTAVNGAVVCRSAVCDPADLKCGLANGNGPCTAGAQCRSNACDTAGTQKCVGCLLDADCGATAFCDATNGSCRPKVANGTACARPAQCTSAVCAADNLCGNIDGQPCTLPTQCRSALCTNGACGAGTDAGAPDAGPDASTPDSGTPDAGPDAGKPDGGADAGLDAGAPDAAPVDASVPDGAKPSDASVPGSDATTADGSAEEPTEEGGIGGGGCSCKVGGARSDTPWAPFGALAFPVALLFLLRRRRAADAR
jgi:MYXO-CTERM domain-containing protein